MQKALCSHRLAHGSGKAAGLRCNLAAYNLDQSEFYRYENKRLYVFNLRLLAELPDEAVTVRARAFFVFCLLAHASRLQGVCVGTRRAA
jgi:hypothetical protein